ncbi:cysteine hydrolase [candidate division WOR-3 bacterium]|nr:cysteine hydrolase [candidate division WOR-3 bacterium]
MWKIIISVLIIIVIVMIILLIIYMKFSSASKGEKIPSYENLKSALLVIDIQRDLTEKNGKAVYNIEQTDQIIENTNLIIENSEKLGLLVIYITHEYKKSFLIKIFTKGALEQDTPGAQIDPRIKIINKNHFIKHMMDSFSNPEFENFLKANKVNHVYITGLDAEACVDRTVKAALNRNYEVTVISNAIAAKSEEKRNVKLWEFEKIGAKVVTTEELLKNP